MKFSQLCSCSDEETIRKISSSTSNAERYFITCSRHKNNFRLQLLYYCWSYRWRKSVIDCVRHVFSYFNHKIKLEYWKYSKPIETITDLLKTKKNDILNSFSLLIIFKSARKNFKSVRLALFDNEAASSLRNNFYLLLASSFKLLIVSVHRQKHSRSNFYQH